MPEGKACETAYVLSSIAHDLRSPLNAVIGFSRLMIKGLDGPISDMQMADLEAIHENGRTMLDMVNNIIDLGKIEAGTLAPDNETTYLEPIVQKALTQVEGALKDKPVRLSSEIEDLLLSVQAGEAMAQQILADLLTVAAHLVGSGTAKLIVRRQEQDIVVQVTGDAPEGLSPETTQTIEGFKSSGTSMEHRINALSLKLLVSQKWVAMHGGTFWVDVPSPTTCLLAFRLPIHRPRA